ncbi:hypothetical protein CFP56_037846 [Quercus suber]|uniref:Uncharacterized protein n=1 Tax=Quercus suber TaxID=58331 RepID=A0AAW0J3Y1_QUESU
MEESASMEIQLATASINNVDQNTQKEADIPGENENKNDELFKRYFNMQFIEASPNVKIEHFTDLLRTFQIPPPCKRPYRGYRMIDLLFTATQHHDAGVKFEWCFESFDSDIKFEKRVLKIPSLELSDPMEVVYRNIIALEQTRYIKEGYFTDYFIFMDLLIKTKKDADLLCDKNILFNCLDDSYAVEFMIKNLNKGIFLINMRNDYVDVSKKLKSFYEQRPWQRRIYGTIKKRIF